MVHANAGVCRRCGKIYYPGMQPVYARYVYAITDIPDG